ncbi:MAG: hypothetical protein ACOCT9_00630 [archaeon]
MDKRQLLNELKKMTEELEKNCKDPQMIADIRHELRNIQEIEDEERKKCIHCGSLYQLKKGKPEICWVCGQKTE